MTSLDNRLKSRDITRPTKVRLVKAMVFPVVMHGCESWTIKKAEHWQINAFELLVLEKTLESPLDCKDIQPVLKEISPECSLEGLMLKLKLQYFAHLMRRADTFEKTLMLGKTECWRRGWQNVMVGWHHRLNGRVWVNSWSWWLTGRPGMLQSLGLQRVRHDWATELNWTEVNWY